MSAAGRRLALLALLGALTTVPLTAQETGPQPSGLGLAVAQRAFVAAARVATAKYHDQAAAVADGYRPIGPDFPAMGEHWINPRLLVKSRIDATRPQILEYATVDGQPTLVGVAYASLVTDRTVPAGPPVEPGAWHFHSGSVDEESLIRGHQGLDHEPGSGPSIAVLHAWIWLDNPAGFFATDNWALPFLRTGLPVPERGAALSAAGKALSLICGGDAFVGAVIRAVGRPDSRDAATIGRILGRYRTLVETRQSLVHERRPLTSRELTDLADLWNQMWAEIESSVNPSLADRLQSISEH